jgi:hypothetical protein
MPEETQNLTCIIAPQQIISQLQRHSEKWLLMCSVNYAENEHTWSIKLKYLPEYRFFFWDLKL